MDGDKKIKVVQLFEENADSCDKQNAEDNPCHRMPTIQINCHNSTIVSRDIHINITVSIN